MNANYKIEALQQSALGAELTPDEAGVLAARMGLHTLAPGDTVVEENEDRRTLIVLIAGTLCVCKSVGGVEETVYQMRVGECAGTRAFVDGSPRRAKLRAEVEGLILTLEPADLEALLDNHPHLVYKVMRALFRITHTNLMRVNLESAEMRNYLTKSGGRY